MDPLSLTASIITVLYLANSIVAVCYEFRSALQDAPWSLTHILDEIRDLRNILETLERISEQHAFKSVEKSRLRSFDVLCEPETGPLASCLKVLTSLQKKIEPKAYYGKAPSKRRALIQVLGWQLNESDARASLQRLECCKSTIVLALTADEVSLLLDIKRMTMSVNNTANNIDSKISDLAERIRRSDLTERDKAMTHWLAPVDPWVSHDTAMSTRYPGTAGSGKTILFANVVAAMNCQTSPLSQDALTSFFYCDFQEKDSQDALNVVGSLVAQLCSQLSSCPRELQNAFEHSDLRSGIAKRPVLPLLKEVFLNMASLRPIALFVDAVDECREGDALVDFLLSLVEASSSIRIFVTCRHNLEVRDFSASFIHITMESYADEVNLDIGNYVDHRLQSDPQLRRQKALLKEEIKHSLMSRSSGMFRLVQCTLDAMSSLRTARSIRQALKELPGNLAKTYENILLQVQPSNTVIVRKILLWLSFTVLPIVLEELHSAIAIEQGLDELDEESCLSSSEDILKVCGSLVSVTDDGHVRLAHMTVKDYLLSDEIRHSPVLAYALDPLSGNRELALDCFAYLTFRDFQTGPCHSLDSFVSRRGSHPFLKHASTAWTYYLRATDSQVQGDPKIFSFFEPGNRQAFMSWVQVLNANDDETRWSLYPRHATSLYYAASFGLLHIVNRLIASGETLDAPGSRFGGTALHGAVCRDQVHVVQALLSAGASPDKSDFDRVTPLHCAASEGHIECLQLLLAHGGSRGSVCRGGETPMDWAIKSHQTEAQELLAGTLSPNDKSGSSSSELKFWSGWTTTYIPEWDKHRPQRISPTITMESCTLTVEGGSRE